MKQVYIVQVKDNHLFYTAVMRTTNPIQASDCFNYYTSLGYKTRILCRIYDKDMQDHNTVIYRRQEV